LQKKKDKSMPSQYPKMVIFVVALACVSPLMLTGCGEKTVKASAPVQTLPSPTVAESKPITNVAPDTSALPPVETAAPPVTTTPPVTAASLPVTPTRTKPVPPPKKQAAEPTTESASEQAPAKPAAPQILPQLSAGDTAAYQQKTHEDINAAEENLRQATGKPLSAAQTDLIQKIQNFLKDSRAAQSEGDWTRAQQLSQKARRVSDELVASF
jgi:outer membrane murein-binding lipoprotein Lpp